MDKDTPAFCDIPWQPMATIPRLFTQVSGAPIRYLLWVPPYGFTAGHFDGSQAKWNCHSVLNKDEQPTHWALPCSPAMITQGDK